MVNPRAEIRTAQWLKAELERLYPDLSEEELVGQVAQETEIVPALAHVIRSAEMDRTIALALAARIDEMQKRLARVELRGEGKRVMVASAMDLIGIRKITEPDFTATLQTGQAAVVIIDETAIPAGFMVQPEPPPPRPDKKLLRQYLKDGASIPGCHLSNAPAHLTVRRS